jgi:hypothetical protein
MMTADSPDGNLIDYRDRRETLVMLVIPWEPQRAARVAERTLFARVLNFCTFSVSSLLLWNLSHAQKVIGIELLGTAVICILLVTGRNNYRVARLFLFCSNYAQQAGYV